MLPFCLFFSSGFLTKASEKAKKRPTKKNSTMYTEFIRETSSKGWKAKLRFLSSCGKKIVKYSVAVWKKERVSDLSRVKMWTEGFGWKIVRSKSNTKTFPVRKKWKFERISPFNYKKNFPLICGTRQNLINVPFYSLKFSSFISFS